MAKKNKSAPVQQGLLFSIAAAAGHMAGKINAAGGQLAAMAGEVVEAVKYKVNERRKQKKTFAKKTAPKQKGKAAKKTATATKKKTITKKVKKAAQKAVSKKTARPVSKPPAKAGEK